MRQFQSCADLLMDQLQVLPMTTTMDLYQRVLADSVQKAAANAGQARRQQSLARAYADFQAASKRLNDILTDLDADGW